MKTSTVTQGGQCPTLGFSKVVSLLLFLLAAQLAAAQCNNLSPFGTAAAPVNASVTVTTCQFAGEYHTITGCAASTNYSSASSVATDFITVRRGTPGGPVVASGTTPLAWASTIAGNYYVHFNLSAACGSDFTCRTVTIAQTCSTPAPTAVTASPVVICAGQNTNVNATSPGNTINWFTVPAGGAAVGTSGSGANAPMTPAVTTTYYASAFNGSCFSARTPVTVTVNPTPTITLIDANPDTVCFGSPSILTAMTCGQIANFTGPFAPANWTTAHIPITDVGIVYPAGAPTSIAIESSNGGNFGITSIYYTATIGCTGTVSFHWDYVTTDVDGSAFDYPEYAINMVNQGMIPGFVAGGPNSQSGNFSLGVTAGQQFSLIMTASDDILGPATTVYSNFSAPGGSNGATINWYTALTGGINLGSSLAGANFPVSPPATTTYYAAATAAGCTSTPRIPITVVARNCVLPIEDVVLGGLTDGTTHFLHWSQQTDGPSMSYEIERSADGQTFAPIGQQSTGQREGDRLQFSYEDRSPLPADNYYRLRHLSPNGDMTYSNTVRLRLADASTSFSLAPSPTQDVSTYRFISSTGSDVEITVTDLLGHKVLQLNSKAQPGTNAIPLDLSQLQAGTYMMRAYHAGTQVKHAGMVVRLE